MHQAALAPARRLWFQIWIALGMPEVPMAMHGAVRQCDGLPAGDRTYRHKRGVAVPALLMSGGWHGRPRARGVVAIIMHGLRHSRARPPPALLVAHASMRTPLCVGAYVTLAPRRRYPCGLGLRPFTATLQLALTRRPPAGRVVGC